MKRMMSKRGGQGEGHKTVTGHKHWNWLSQPFPLEIWKGDGRKHLPVPMSLPWPPCVPCAPLLPFSSSYSPDLAWPLQMTVRKCRRCQKIHLAASCPHSLQNASVPWHTVKGQKTKKTTIRQAVWWRQWGKLMSNSTYNSIPSEHSCSESRNYPPGTEVPLLKAGASGLEESDFLGILWAMWGNDAGEH